MKEDYLDPGDGAGEMVQYEGDGDGGAYDDNYYEDPSAAVMEFDNSANILNSKGENYPFLSISAHQASLMKMLKVNAL